MRLEHVTLRATNDNKPYELELLGETEHAYLEEIKENVSMDTIRLASERKRVANAKIRAEALVKELPGDVDAQKDLAIWTMRFNTLLKYGAGNPVQ